MTPYEDDTLVRAFMCNICLDRIDVYVDEDGVPLIEDESWWQQFDCCRECGEKHHAD